MDLKERIQELCKINKTSMNQIEEELGFGKGYISKLGKSTPNTAKIQKIANKFDVTVDYLMTGEDTSNENARNQELSNVYFSLAKEAEQDGIDPRDIKMAIDMIKKLRGEK